MMPAVRSSGQTSSADVEAWYRAHRAELVRLAGLALGDRDRGEEVVQEVFARVYRRPPVLEQPGEQARYLRSAVLNSCRSRLTRRATGRRATDRLQRQVTPQVTSTEDAGVGSVTRDQVLAAVRRLPRRQRDVVLLRYWLDLPEAEIAATLGVSAGTVKTSAHRAMHTLAPLLEDLR
jgi:RNA polymerase sigma-70 factor (sigma-E family)